MSNQQEKYEAQNIANSTEESDNAFDTVTIPVPSEEPQESDQTEEHESGIEQFSESRAIHFEEQSDQSFSSLEPDNEQLMEEVISPRQVSYTPQHCEKQYAMQRPNDDSLAFLDKIKSIKESLQESMEDSLATVRVVLIPVGQEIVIPFKVDTILKYLKDHFSHLLGIPHSVLQIRYSGKILKNNETLVQHGVKPQEIVQVEIFSANPDLYPVKRIDGLTDVSQIVTVTVQTGLDQYQQVPVEIVKSDFHKPFLGGFRHKITGVEYHNAGTQTVPKRIPERLSVFCRDTQTVFQKKNLQQTTSTTSTQMTNIGVYVSNMTDKLVTPGRYFSAAEYHAQRLKAVIVIQTYYRQWHAKIFVENLRRQKNLRLEWETQQELRKIREKEEWIKLDYHRRHNPKTNEDFEFLYNALEFWRQEELTRVNQSFTGAERKAALCELLEKEIQIIASIGRHRYIAYMANQEAAIQAFLDKCSAPKIWRTPNGKTIEMDTQFTIRARELQNIYKCIMLKNISQDERLDVLLTLKHTVKEHECKLTREILELIDREVDLMMRGVKHHNLEGLRKRIATLFFHYIKTPLFNPEVAKYLKVPQDPLKFYKKIYFCHSCQLYLPSTEFSVSSTSRRIYRCRNCISLENEAQKRESFLKYKCLLQQLYYTEADYEDDSKIAFLMQLQDIQYLTENIWASQSVLSACDNLSDLVMVRWNKSLEWSPWNCILLTKDEAAAHLKLTSIEEGYERSFIHKIKHKHILAKNYFSQIPVLASFILNDGEIDEIRWKYHSDTTPKIIESQRPPP
ncbi:IQ motif and ubiquitin-like domain-containing protein isoform X1 [Symphalangus syndactylus]|uniref:IQ motif and ubiquitin-like domain-containing protein isoform X1 n=1 Tax=Symphalangus syndactylus TaxID=9590 RepID=UPI0024417B87|nr:IQ and ubiquitin-like domain-containing protein isoform X1 [Symphalangus syndactylus]XP_055139817.1 IQ and ubiquitin-like domain-containing protein isoform X1 [Symphalangus syndactylus]